MEKREIIAELEKLIHKEVDTSKLIFDKNLNHKHMDLVRHYAVMLAKKLNADVFLVETGALLHDVGRLKFGYKRGHELTGAEETEKILGRLKCDAEFIEKAKRAVLTHRARSEHKPKTLEEKIVACADAMSHFDEVPEILITFHEVFKSVDKAKEMLRRKLERDWIKISRVLEAKPIIKERYEAAMLLLK